MAASFGKFGQYYSTFQEMSGMKLLKNWAPALVMMVIIFGFSSIPSEEMPSFGGLDFSIKKFGHAFGYALLALAYLRGLKFFKHEGHQACTERSRSVNEGKGLPPFLAFVDFVFKHPSFFAWLMALLFSATDEFHQSFVPGRNPSLWDVFLFDNLGALAGLWAGRLFRKRNQKDDASAPPSAF